jgi:hypothetical protein
MDEQIKSEIFEKVDLLITRDKDQKSIVDTLIEKGIDAKVAKLIVNISFAQMNRKYKTNKNSKNLSKIFSSSKSLIIWGFGLIFSVFIILKMVGAFAKISSL